MATLSKFSPSAPANEFFRPAGAFRPHLYSLVSCFAVCSGCWSEAEVPAPLPVPIADPQIVPRPAPPLEAGDFAAVRKFRFFYDVTVTDLSPGEKARIWVPVAVDGAQQRVIREQTNIPGEIKESIDATSGNHVLATEATANDKGEIPLRVTYLVERVEALPGAGEKVSEAMPKEAFEQYEGPSGFDLGMESWLASKRLPNNPTAKDQVRHLFYEVAEKKESPGVFLMTTALVNVCRASQIPADVEWGFVIGNEAKGSVSSPTLWAKAALDGRWEMLDVVSGMDQPQLAHRIFGTLSPDRILFHTGDGYPWLPATVENNSKPNVTALPYIQVQGKTYETLLSNSIKTNFRYEDTTDKIE